MHARIRAAIERAFPDEASRSPVVLAVPGYLRVDDATGERLSRFEVLWNDDESRRMRFREWAAENPKRFLVGTVVVGTIDQVLLSALRIDHAHLRATALLRHVLVVDEVHASGAYMNAILDCVLAFHQAAGGHTLLMSATLGSAARARHFGQPQPTLAAALDAPYPAVTHRDNGLTASMTAVPRDSRAKHVSVECARICSDPKSIASRALDAAAAGGRVLVLRNTVADAVATPPPSSDESAPHARGSTRVDRVLPPLLSECPARAGIDPACRARSSASSRVPRTRGDRPETTAYHGDPRWSAPHARGSTHPHHRQQ